MHMTTERGLAATLLVLALVACTPKEPLVRSGEIENARSLEALSALYQRIDSEPASGARASERTQTLELIRNQFRGRLGAQIKQRLDQGRLDSGLVNLTALTEASAMLNRWEKGFPQIVSSLSAMLSNERQRSLDYVEGLQHQAERIPASNFVERLNNADKLAQLLDTEQSRQRYRSERQSIIETLSQRIEEAFNQRSYEQAISLIEQLGEIAPNHPQLGDWRAQALADRTRQRVESAIAAGEPDIAQQMLEDALQQGADRTNLRAPGTLLAEFYAEQSLPRSRAGLLDLSVEDLRKSLWLQRNIGVNQPVIDQARNTLVETLYESANNASARDLVGLEYGYLLVIQEFQPDFPGLDRLLREAREGVFQRAVKRVSVEPFSDEAERSFAANISARVTQILFEELGAVTRLVEREQLNAVMRELDLDAQQDLGQELAATLASANFLIQGAVLEASVESSQASGTRTERVVVRQEQQDNPAWQAWQADKQGPEPAKTITVPVQEDVSYEVTRHRKNAIVSVSYRLVEAGTARVANTRTITVDTSVEDESTDGLSIGEFSVPLTMAELPSDLEILNQLAREASRQIADDLIKLLQSPEEEYRVAGAQAAEEKNYPAAAESMAYAVVLAERKDLDTDNERTTLKTYALSSGI